MFLPDLTPCQVYSIRTETARWTSRSLSRGCIKVFLLQVDFQEFVQGVSKLSDKGDKVDKLK